MIISDFTQLELEYMRCACNFVNSEKDVFYMRSQGMTLENIAEVLNMSVENVKKISRKVNNKILKVMA